MEIVYKLGKENIVADWFFLAIMINAMDEYRGKPSRDVRQLLQEWTLDGMREPGTQERDDETHEDDDSVDERPSEMEKVEKIINAKRRQMIWKTIT